ncbi:Ubiquitin carboxyl-terminal hydrolase 8 [Chamberlinius hualienensis]
MSKKKEVSLYLAKSFSELNTKIDVDVGRDPKSLMRSVPGLFKTAESLREDGDEERSYILYMRFYNAARSLQKSFRNDKKYFESMIKSKDIVTSIEWAEKLSESLEKRYELLKEEDETTEKLKRLGFQDEKVTDEPVVMNVKNHDTDQSRSSTNDEINVISVSKSVDCKALYDDLVNNSSNILIMDVRSDKDFENSHINSSRCINIPEHIITPGSTAPKLRTLIPSESKEFWDKRGNVDIIYILDWFSKLDEMSPTVKSLKDAIFMWDTITNIKREPVILTGGYDKWLTYYPTMTTNYPVERPVKDGGGKKIVIDLNFEYPSDDLDRAFIAAPEEALLSDDSNVSSLSAVPATARAGTFKALPSIDRTTKPKFEPVKEVANLAVKHSKPEIEWNDVNTTKSQPLKPTINRTLKPNVVNMNATEDEKMANERLEMWDQLSKYEKYANEAILMEKDRLQKEKELMELRHRGEKEAEEAMRLDLQKQEIELLDKISILEENQKRQENENMKVLEENEILKNRLKDSSLQNDEECKRLKDELIKNLKRETERRNLEKEVQKLRLERIKAEKSKENAKLDKPEHPVIKPHNSNSEKLPNSERNNFKTINNPPNNFSSDFSTIKGKYVALKDSNSSGYPSRSGKLSRAHSFHNISQIGDSEEPLSSSSSFGERSIVALESANQQRVTPIIDRCSKPSPTEISGTFTRNFMPVFGGSGRALTGLRNLGNTCYMNSVIQSLANTVPLVDYFRSGLYREHLNRSGKFKGILVDEFAAIIQALHVGQYRSIAPKDFRNVISQYDNTFESCEQQDPQEFLNCVIDNLHEELKISKSDQAIESAANLSKSLDDSTLPDDQIAAKSWAMYKMLHNSIITEMFQGQYRSTLKCLHCSKKAVKFDTFMFLSLPIPSGVNRCTLKDCLQMFIKEEKLTGGSKWKCPRCKELREAVKKIDIWKLPLVLLIHFKRFYYEGVWKGKMQTYIDFPVSEPLDLQSFVKGNESQNVFNLYGVTNHSGTLDGGHCIAYCKNANYNRWYKYDDQDVREMPESDVKSSGAYILYYISKRI